MNTEQLQQQSDALRHYGAQAEQHTTQLLAAYFIGLALYFLFVAATGIHCASKGPEKNNTSWMILIVFIPVIGAPAYWIFRPSFDDGFGASTGSGVFPAPAPPTSRNIADEITADLAKRKRP